MAGPSPWLRPLPHPPQPPEPHSPGTDPPPRVLSRALLPLNAYFSPLGGCTQAVVNAILAAQREILVQAYSFTSLAIASALVGTSRRGVSVSVLLDPTDRSARDTAAHSLLYGGIHVLVDDKHTIAHNKVMILDHATVITGSFNFTEAAEHHNAENLLIIPDPALADTYTANWQAHKVHSVPF